MHRPRFVLPSKISRPVLPIAFAVLGALGSACKSTEGKSEAPSQPAHTDHVDLSNELTAKATVVAIDKAERLITLRNEDGSAFTVQAGSAVRNFDQIAVGDELRVRYKESLSASLMPAGTSAAPVEGAFVAGRAKEGETPAAGMGLAASTRVKIESVDAPRDIVVFSLSSGELRAVRAVRPEGRAFVAGLEVGNIVQLDYSVSLALAIEKL